MKTVNELKLAPLPWGISSMGMVVKDGKGHFLAEVDGKGIGNSRLMAAAPDLYKALDEFCEWVDGQRANPQVAAFMRGPMFKQMIAALEKAGGNK